MHDRHEMKSFFEPAINDLLAKVKEQKDQLTKKGSKIDVSAFPSCGKLKQRIHSF